MLPYLRLIGLVLLLGWGRSGAAQPALWQPVKLDSVASIEFPDSVTRKQVQGQLVYVCQAGPTLCIVVRQTGSSLLGLLSSSADFGKGLVKGLLEETKGQLVAQHRIEVSGFKGVEVQFTTPSKPELPATKYTRMVVVNGTIYVLNYWTNAEQDAASTAERTRFFTSFSVKAQPELVGPDVRKLGSLAGRLLAYLVLAGVLLGAILLLRRRRATPR